MPTFHITLALPVLNSDLPLLHVLNRTFREHREKPNYTRVHLMMHLFHLKCKEYPHLPGNMCLHTNWASTVDRYLNTEWDEILEGTVDRDKLFAEMRFLSLVQTLVDGPWYPVKRDANRSAWVNAKLRFVWHNGSSENVDAASASAMAPAMAPAPELTPPASPELPPTPPPTPEDQRPSAVI